MLDIIPYIGQNIQNHRKMKKMTQETLAELVGIAVTTISHIEIGVRNPSLETLIDIANALGVSADQLLAGNLKNNPPEFQAEVGKLLSDCHGYEKKIIFEQVQAIKKSLREIRYLISK